MIKTFDPVRLAPSQKGQAAQMLGRAFMKDPAYQTLFADEQERAESLTRLFGAVIGYSMVYGQVDTMPKLEGATCWVSPGKTEVTLWRMLRTGMGLQRAVAGFRPEPRRQFLAALEQMDASHKQAVTEPHWYLWALGVDPESQGQGIGSKLLQPVLRQADQDGVPCYLETMAERNLGFYDRYGFETVGQGTLMEGRVTFWSMLRGSGA